MTNPSQPPQPVSPAEMAVRGVSAATFDEMYRGTPPWEIGRPQPEVMRLADAGALAGRILDVGCGTGENALHLAERGFDVFGIDLTASAIERATDKARQRGSAARFAVHDALDLPALNATFDTILDSALFHVFSDADRPRYVAGLAACLRPGGRLILICFSEHETRDRGPRRVTQAEIRTHFAAGWLVEDIRAIRYEVNMYPDGARTWLASVRRMN